MVYVEDDGTWCQTCGQTLESEDPFDVWLCECPKKGETQVREFQVNIKVKAEEIDDKTVEEILLNIVEHVARERDYWQDEGIISEDDDIEPVVVETPGDEDLVKRVNEKLREGYFFQDEQETLV